MGMFDLVAYNWQVLWSVITQLTLPQSKMKKVLRIKFLHLQTSLRFLLRDDEAESSTSVFDMFIASLILCMGPMVA
jgi:hypothetical protein